MQLQPLSSSVLKHSPCCVTSAHFLRGRHSAAGCWKPLLTFPCFCGSEFFVCHMSQPRFALLPTHARQWPVTKAAKSAVLVMLFAPSSCSSRSSRSKQLGVHAPQHRALHCKSAGNTQYMHQQSTIPDGCHGPVACAGVHASAAVGNDMFVSLVS